MKPLKILLTAAGLLSSAWSLGQTFSVEGFTYQIHRGNKAILKSCSLTDVEVSIPSSVRNGDVTYIVDSIANTAFSKKVTLSTHIPSTITGIGNNAFVRAQMDGHLVLPSGLKYLGNSVFASKGITGEVVLPKSLISMGTRVFDKCTGISSVKILGNLSNTGNASFGTLSGLRNLYYNVPDYQQSYTLVSASNDGNIIVTVGKDVKTFDMSMFSSVDNMHLEFETGGTQPLSIINSGQDSMDNVFGDFVFSDRPLFLGPWAFYRANFVNVKLYDNVRSLGNFAFADCTSLQRVEFRATADNLTDESCQIEPVFWCAGVSTGYDLFIGKEIVHFPSNMFGIDMENKRNSGVRSVTFENGTQLVSFPDCALAGNLLLTELTIPESVRTIGTNAFTGCSISELIFPEGLKDYTYQELAIDEKKLKKIQYDCINAHGTMNFMTEQLVIGPKVESIDLNPGSDYANSMADKVRILSDRLTHIGTVARTDTILAPSGLFNAELDTLGYFCGDYIDYIDCDGYLRIPDNLKTRLSRIGKILNLRKIYYGTDAVKLKDFIHEQTWEHMDSLIIGRNVHNIGTDNVDAFNIRHLAFADGCVLDSIGELQCDSLRDDVVFPESLRVIEKLYNAPHLLSIKLPYGLEKIGSKSFSQCSSLNCDLEFPETLKEIGTDAFADCPALSCRITLPENLEKLGDTAFDNTNIIEIIIPDNPHTLSVTSGVTATGGWIIKNPVSDSEENAVPRHDKELYQGRNLSYNTVAMQMSTAIIHCSPFRNDTTLVKAELGDLVTHVSRGEFQGCSRLRFVRLGENVDSIYREAFAGCSSLERLEIHSHKLPLLEGSYWDSREYDILSSVNREILGIYVSDELVDAFKAHSYWGKFRIFPLSGSGINGLPDEKDAEEVARYTSDGIPLTKPTPGLNIIRYNDGTVRKIIIR